MDTHSGYAVHFRVVLLKVCRALSLAE
jgi:hypothetical protein